MTVTTEGQHKGTHIEFLLPFQDFSFLLLEEQDKILLTKGKMCENGIKK